MSVYSDPPFVGSRAFNSRTRSYVTFPTQSDAMLASLLLSQDVSVDIMNLVFSVVAHPDFDSKQIRLTSLADVMGAVQDDRVKEGMDVMHKRSLNTTKDYVVHAGFPLFVLEEVLDIIEADRRALIESRMKQFLRDEDMDPKAAFPTEENITLCRMSLVHRSWTIPTQKALSRSIYIGTTMDYMDHLIRHLEQSIVGPWTSLVAVDIYYPDIDDANENFLNDGWDSFRESFEDFHKFLLGFRKLKHIRFRSYCSELNRWFSTTIREMVQQNERLKELTLCAMEDDDLGGSLDLDLLIGNNRALRNLEVLNVRGGSLRNRSWELGEGLPSLRNLKFRVLPSRSTDKLSLLHFLSTKPSTRLESLYLVLPPELEFLPDLKHQFTSLGRITLFGHLRSLQIVCDSSQVAEKWMGWIAPYCSKLEYIYINICLDFNSWLPILKCIPRTIQDLKLRVVCEYEEEHESCWKAWGNNLLVLVQSRHFPELASLSIEVAGNDSTSIQIFSKEMESRCLEACITYSSYFCSW